MTFKRLPSHIEDGTLSRRGFLPPAPPLAGALIAEPQLAVGTTAKLANPEEFVPNVRPHRSDGKVVLTMPYVRNGQGTYNLGYHADRRRLR